ncbi:MAG: sulfatase [Phycisphaeraceae bacterium]|nr:MAG: sulfatase [Phycisphaeraceae bacterium]
MTRPGIASLLAVLFVLVGSPAAARAAEGDSRPNIIYVMSDDHGWQAISAYGSNRNKTPNIDRLAREGMRLDRFFVGNSICAPARATMLTGLHSHANGMMDNRTVFDGSQRTIAKMLHAAGYQTVMLGKWHLESEPTAFDYFDHVVGQGTYYNPEFRRGGLADGYEQYTETGYVTDIITDKAIDWIENRRDTDRPFLMLLHNKAPHRPWDPAPRHLTLFDDVQIPEPATLFDDWSGRGTPAHTQEMTIAEHLFPRDLKFERPWNLNESQRRMWDSVYGPKNDAFNAMALAGDDLVRWKYQRYVKDYLRCVQAVDENVGRLLDELTHSGLDENTIVIYTSDQGWYLGENGWFDKRWMYEESFRTPFLVRWPGVIPEGSTSTALTQNIDIAPTMLDAAGLGVPDDMHGVSMLPVLRGHTPDDWRRSLYYRYYEYPGWHSVRRHEGVRTERYTLIHFYEPDVDEWEFYDLDADPGEMSNAIDKPRYAEKIAELKKELERLKTLYHVPPGEFYTVPEDGRRE